MRVTQVVAPDMERHSGLSQGWPPHRQPEPVTWHMAIGIHRPRLPYPILICGTALGSVDGICGPAVLTPASACRVTAQAAMPVTTPGGVRRGQPKGRRVGEYSHCGRRDVLPRDGEEQVIVPELASP